MRAFYNSWQAIPAQYTTRTSFNSVAHSAYVPLGMLAWVVTRAVSSLALVVPATLIHVFLATSVGGDLYYSLGLSILGNVPTRPQWPTKLHAWINAGRLQGINGCTSFFFFVSSHD